MTVNHLDASIYAQSSNFDHYVEGNMSNTSTELDRIAMRAAKASELVTALPRPRAVSDQRTDCSKDGSDFSIGCRHDMHPGELPYSMTSVASQHTPSVKGIDVVPGCSSNRPDEHLPSRLNVEPSKTYSPLFTGPPAAARPSNVSEQLVPIWTLPSTTSTGPSPTSAPWQNIPHVYTSRQLLPLLDGTGIRARYQPDDKVVWLPTFQARVFITCHPASPIELQTYSQLIMYGAEDCFYRLPDAETKTRMHSLEVAGLAAGQLPTLNNARALRQEVAWVHGAAALRTADMFKELPCRDSRHHKSVSAQYEQSQSESDDDEYEDSADNVRVSRASIPSCRRCAKVAQAKLGSVGTMYISIVKSTQMQPGLDLTAPTAANVKSANHAINGVDIYRVVKSGSRDAAATQAFYNAGARGLSTVFTCVVRGDVDWRVAAQRGLRRAEGLWELAEESDGPVPVFF